MKTIRYVPVSDCSTYQPASDSASPRARRSKQAIERQQRQREELEVKILNLRQSRQRERVERDERSAAGLPPATAAGPSRHDEAVVQPVNAKPAISTRLCTSTGARPPRAAARPSATARTGDRNRRACALRIEDVRVEQVERVGDDLVRHPRHDPLVQHGVARCRCATASGRRRQRPGMHDASATNSASTTAPAATVVLAAALRLRVRLRPSALRLVAPRVQREVRPRAGHAREARERHEEHVLPVVHAARCRRLGGERADELVVSFRNSVTTSCVVLGSGESCSTIQSGRPIGRRSSTMNALRRRPTSRQSSTRLSMLSIARRASRSGAPNCPAARDVQTIPTRRRGCPSRSRSDRNATG